MGVVGLGGGVWRRYEDLVLVAGFRFIVDTDDPGVEAEFYTGALEDETAALAVVLTTAVGAGTEAVGAIGGFNHSHAYGYPSL